MNVIATLLHRDTLLYLFAMTASLLLSLIIDSHEAIINPDAICYLLSAQAVGESGIHTAMHLCGQAQWPFYSALIFGFVQISQLPYSAAAYLLDSIFSLLSVLTFILIVKELGGSRRVLWSAALVILLAHEFNDVRQYIVRDHGFWAFYLVSILCMLRYFRRPQWITCLGFSFSLAIATLFRIEGAIFLLTLPLLAWFCPPYSLRQRARLFLSLNALTFVICLAVASWLFLHPQQSLDKLGRVAEVTQQLQHGWLVMLERYQSTKLALAQHVLTVDSAKDAGLILWLVLLSWYLVNVLANLSCIYALLVVSAWWRKAALFSSQAKLVLCSYLLVNSIITFGFLAERLFLSKRYLIALSLVFMLWVPFALNDFIRQRQRWRFALAVLLIFVTSLGGIFDFGYSKEYIRTAGAWLSANVPANASLYANDYQLMYYSQHYGNSLFEKLPHYAHIDAIAHNQWKQYDYLALRLNQKDEADMAYVLQEIKMLPVQVFTNKRGDRVAIYKVGEHR